MRADEPVALTRDAEVRLGLGAAADQVGLVEHRDDRPVLVVVPAPGGVLAAQVLTRVLDEPERPGLDILGELSVVPRVAAYDARGNLGGERHALPEEPLVSLDDEVAAVRDAGRGHLREHLRHVRLDDRVAERERDRDAVVPVADEMQVADAVDGDRRHPAAAALCEVDPLPALSEPVRRGPKPAVEVGRAVDAADDRAKLDDLEPDPALAGPPHRRHDLVERQDQVDVVGPAAQSAGECRQHLPPPGPLEVGLGVEIGETRVPGHDLKSHTRNDR